jgi:hypothetical protein
MDCLLDGLSKYIGLFLLQAEVYQALASQAFWYL